MFLTLNLCNGRSDCRCFTLYKDTDVNDSRYDPDGSGTINGEKMMQKLGISFDEQTTMEQKGRLISKIKLPGKLGHVAQSFHCVL